MRGLRKLACILITLCLLCGFDAKVEKKLTGGVIYTKSMSIWQLCRYRDVDLLRKFPYCPFKAYLTVHQYVSVEERDNRNCLVINGDLKAATKADTTYNRKFARKFKAKCTDRQKVRRIYNFCRKIEYKAHVKTAKEAFETRQGDCAAIAAAFYVLCTAKKIPVRYIIGWKDGACHAWNRVKIGKKWYYIDATLGDWLTVKKDGQIMEVW